MTIQEGEWHTVTATSDPPEMMDFDIEHHPDCPKQVYCDWVWEYTCDLGIEISNQGSTALQIDVPGTYRARVITEIYPATPWHGEEYEVYVEVEPL